MPYDNQIGAIMNLAYPMQSYLLTILLIITRKMRDYIKIKRRFGSPIGQSTILQNVVSEGSPEQYCPSYCGAGTVQDLLCDLVPFPQVAVQALHSPQVVHWPSVWVLAIYHTIKDRRH